MPPGTQFAALATKENFWRAETAGRRFAAPMPKLSGVINTPPRTPAVKKVPRELGSFASHVGAVGGCVRETMRRQLRQAVALPEPGVAFDRSQETATSHTDGMVDAHVREVRRCWQRVGCKVCCVWQLPKGLQLTNIDCLTIDLFEHVVIGSPTRAYTRPAMKRGKWQSPGCLTSDQEACRAP